MKVKFLFAVLLGLALAISTSQAQAPASPAATPIGAEKNPQDPVPGVLMRVYVGGTPNPKANPTHLIAIAKDGDECSKTYIPQAKNELRGVSKSLDLYYIADGYIILDKDTDVNFKMGEAGFSVNGKGFGDGTFVKNFKKGKYPFEVTRRWGKGQGGFTITDGAGKPVIFYTGDMVTREMARSYKLEGHTFRTKLLGEAVPTVK